jgi:hypothetical protein
MAELIPMHIPVPLPVPSAAMVAMLIDHMLREIDH